MTTWPLQSQCDAFYGNPRGSNGQASALWKLRNLTTITPPFKMHMGNVPITRITVHRKCAAAFSAWLQKVWDNAGHDQAKIALWGMDVFSGSFNYRVKRGGSTLSMHAYGCAIDMDAPRNEFHSSSGHFNEFRQQVVQPFLDLGGEWGGNWQNATDPMHFQFALVSAPKAAAVPVSKPLPVGNRLIGEPIMATTTNKILNVNTLNIGSIAVIAGALGDILPQIIKEGTTVGWVAAAALTVAVLVQFFMPPATAKAIEGAIVTGVIPVAENVFPAQKLTLEEIKQGIQDAQGVTNPAVPAA